MTAESAGEHRAGCVSVVGRPNVGKSSLVNALVGHKVAIVTPRAQTTRNRLRGILTRPGYQIVFTDTPGLHRRQGHVMNQALNRAAAAAIVDADVTAAVFNCNRWTGEDDDVVARLAETKQPVVAVINKVDLVRPREQLLPFIAELSARRSFAALVPVSARTGEMLDRLEAVLVEHLPPSPPLYEPGVATDQSTQFYAAEILREKLIYELRDEIPYGISVVIERFAQARRGWLIGAVVWVEREGQKGIVIGAGGERLRKVARRARLELRAFLDRPVHLEVWVKVKKRWTDDTEALRTLGVT